MVARKFNVIQLNTGFETAHRNMHYDEELLNQLQPEERIERFYIWQQPGITYSYKQTCPENMQHFDHSSRLTGGGIVFHSPGDIVFSIAEWRHDPEFTGGLKQRLAVISDHIKQALTKQNIQLDAIQATSEINHRYCHQYPTPFEITVNDQKIVGLTIRQFKTKRLIQGIIHTKPAASCFHPFFDLSIQIDHEQLLSHLLN